VPPHVRDPVDPHVVGQPMLVPSAQVNVSSTRVSQSSSRPLHVSSGAVHAPHVQSLPHVRDPVEPQVVVHASLSSRTHANTSSGASLQSSSMPLHVSAGATHTLQPHAALHVRIPAVPHAVVQVPVSPRQHAKPSSHPISQSSSMPLQISGAPGNTSGFASLQSVAGTPPVSAQLASPKPSESESIVLYAHRPPIDSSQRSLVQASSSLQSIVTPGAQTMSTQVSTPLHETPSAHSGSVPHTRGGQPMTGSHIDPSRQRE
jgi:hypothetical protein